MLNNEHKPLVSKGPVQRMLLFSGLRGQVQSQGQTLMAGWDIPAFHSRRWKKDPFTDDVKSEICGCNRGVYVRRLTAERMIPTVYQTHSEIWWWEQSSVGVFAPLELETGTKMWMDSTLTKEKWLPVLQMWSTLWFTICEKYYIFKSKKNLYK